MLRRALVGLIVLFATADASAARSALVASALAAKAVIAKEKEEEKSAVPMLTGDNFDKFIEDNPITLVKFMAPWCGHCKKLAPEYEAAAQELQENDPKVALVEVDATVDQKLSEKYQVRGFPTLFLFRNGKPEPYTGGRTKSLIVEWVKKMTGPPVDWIQDKDTIQAINQWNDQSNGLPSKSEKSEEESDSMPEVTFVGVFKSKADATVFENVASSNRLKGSFKAFVDPDVAAAEVRVLRPYEEMVKQKITADEKDLETFLEAEHIPLFGQINGENYATYASRSDNWVWFAGDKADFQKHGSPIRKVSKNYRTEFNFVWIDTNQLKHHAESALGLHEFPSMAILFEKGKYHVPIPDMTSEKALTKFIENVRSGKVKKFLKSEPVPTSNDGPVKIVVGSQFADIVLQKDKDVFLKVYAPWCGHCKKIAPIWEQLGERTKDSKNFIVAKLDGTANEIEPQGFDFHGFPTLFFIKAGSKTPIPYDGDRTFDAFVDFAKKHAAHPIILSESAQDEESKDEL